MKSRKLARSDLLSPLLVLALVAVLVAVLGPSSPLVAQAGQRPHAGATVLSWAERGAPRLPGVSVRLPAEWDARRVVAPVQWEPVGPSLSIERGEGGYLLAPRGQSLSGHPQPLTMVQEHNSVPLRVGIPALILLGVDLTRLEPASSVEVTVTTNAAAYRIEVRETAAVAAVEAEVVSGRGSAAPGPFVSSNGWRIVGRGEGPTSDPVDRAAALPAAHAWTLALEQWERLEIRVLPEP